MPNRRVLDRIPVATLAEHAASGGLSALETARATDPAVVIDIIRDAGLRGRGGAGFPTGVKWRTVADNSVSSPIAPTVVVNAAEGEPGTFGDRAILRANPYRVLEGALIAAHAVGARSIVVTTKERFVEETTRLRDARDELRGSGALAGVDIEIVTGPAHYLLGEETALLEVTSGRPPFPRIAPPYRHGATEVVDEGAGQSGAGRVHLAGPEGGDAPPTLVNNVETLAHVPGIVQNGDRWFRMLGTDESPGTSVFTVSGDTERSGVGEFPLGTPVRDIITELGGDVIEGEIAFVLSGIANGVLTADELDTPTTYEAMGDRGSGLGTGGFLVFSTATDPIAVAHGVSRFLAIESCGQCTPCKQDGLDVADMLDKVRKGTASSTEVDAIRPVLARVPEGARCDLARQHERVVASILDRCAYQSLEQATDAISSEPVLIAPITGFDDEGRAEIDTEHRTKQPDWTHADHWNGQSPADRYDVAVSIS
ncbi:NADH-ubiquinone oxidoreductase-F iron-sulfur binding region domain-containing protein [Actinospongicola halichondriae]|uniref:NADH-ubiquinone oxidoreductase-F iron-sulfur binding region domain-containing protein n=1 Tax=Actinospongicola halichondriae TaxID=3236844 RepID=UPI003D543C1C